MIVAAVVYALCSLWEHTHFRTGFDLAIADQAVWGYSHFHAPMVTTTAGFLTAPGTDPHLNELGDHFSPILALLAPLYWVWPDARMLLIAQGVLLASAGIPVFLFSRDRVGRAGAYLLCVAFLLFWGIHAAVGFDFHELAFTPLLIALVILFADRESWKGYWVSIGLLLVVKESMAVLVVFSGMWLLIRSEYRRAAITITAGIAWYFLTTDVLMPALSAGRPYAHWTFTAFGPDLPHAVDTIVHHPAQVVNSLIDSSVKIHTLGYLFVPFLLLIVWSPLALLCVPLVLQQFLSSHRAFWGTSYHYWLPLAPVLAMGAADGARRVLRLLRYEHNMAWAGPILGAVIVCANLYVAESFPVWRTASDEFSLARTPSDRMTYKAIMAVPSGAPVITQSSLLPHLSERHDIFLLGSSPAMPAAKYLVVNPDALWWPRPDLARAWLHRHMPQYRLLISSGPVKVFKRRL